MSEQDLMRLREMLLKQRKEIFERLRQFKSDWQALEERDIELEEEAQKADLTGLFDHLDERRKDEIEEIDLALCKMAMGRYGLCENCAKPISLNRLEALLATRLCRRCARKFEEKQMRLPPPREVITRGEVPSEYRDLTDDELQVAIFEHFKNDGRIDQEELEITCKKGVVYLQGAVPSESEHQIMLGILTDVMGFTAIVDLLDINELIWERDDRAPGRAPFPPSADEDTLSDDVVESQEEEIPYFYPDRPPPEKE